MASYLLGDRYVRVDALQSDDDKTELAMDVATPEAQRIIDELAQQAIEQSGDKLQRFVGHQAGPVAFFHGPNAVAVGHE